MKRVACILVAGMTLVGCAEKKLPTGPSQGGIAQSQNVIATIGSQQVTHEQLYAPLAEAHGLSLLINLSLLELAKQECRDMGVQVTQADIDAEHKLSMKRLSEDAEEKDYPALFEQLLNQLRISRQEFLVVEQTNAHLRKLATPRIAGKFTDEQLKEAFGARYGETVHIRHIQCANRTELAEVRRRLAAGEKFENVARALSRNLKTRLQDGDWPPFSRNDTRTPQAFKDVAFSLQQGQISEDISTDSGFHIIKLEQKIPPRAVKYEDVRDSVRTWLEDQAVTQEMNLLRARLNNRMFQTIQIYDPILRKQFEDKISAVTAQAKAEDTARKEMLSAATQPATEPTTAPARATAPVAPLAPATAPATAPAAHPAP